MSESGPPPLPPPPIPASPLPVQSLGYADTSSGGKPGLVIAVGVLAIIIASLSGIANLIFGGYAMFRYEMARTMATMSGRPAVTATVTPPPNTALNLADTAVAVNAVQSSIRLDGARVRELGKLLRSHGRDVFPLEDDAAVTAAAINEMILQKQAAPTGADPAFFTTQAGRVDVFPDRALFTSTDGSRTIQSSAAKNTDADSATTAPASQPSDTLSPSQVRKVMKSVTTMAQPPLSSEQISTIQAQISAAHQQLINPTGGTPVTSVMVTPLATQGNSAMVQFDNGNLTVGSKGEITSMYSFKQPVAAAMPAYFAPRQHMGAMKLMMIEAAASAALAVYLLVVGIMVFRSSFKSPRLLRIYTWIKIPLAIVAGLAFLLVNYESASDLFEMLAWPVTLALAGLAFPIGLLLVLRTKTFREFFADTTPA